MKFGEHAGSALPRYSDHLGELLPGERDLKLVRFTEDRFLYQEAWLTSERRIISSDKVAKKNPLHVI